MDKTLQKLTKRVIHELKTPGYHEEYLTAYAILLAGVKYAMSSEEFIHKHGTICAETFAKWREEYSPTPDGYFGPASSEEEHIMNLRDAEQARHTL